MLQGGKFWQNIEHLIGTWEYLFTQNWKPRNIFTTYVSTHCCFAKGSLHFQQYHYLKRYLKINKREVHNNREGRNFPLKLISVQFLITPCRWEIFPKNKLACCMLIRDLRVLRLIFFLIISLQNNYWNKIQVLTIPFTALHVYLLTFK